MDEPGKTGAARMTPVEVPRAFAAAFGAQDADRIAALLAEDATVLTLTGAWAEGRRAATEVLRAEFAGTFMRARLVTGRAQMREVSVGVTLLHQRFVVSGAQGPDGVDLPRFAAMLSAVLAAGPAGWLAAHLGFSGLAE